MSRSSAKLLTKVEEYQCRTENWLVDRQVLKSQSDYQKFVIVCNIRTGSTLLSSLLSSHPQVVCFFELFHRHLESIPFSVPGYQAKGNRQDIVNMRNADPVQFLKTEIYKPQQQKMRAVGFKLLYPQCRQDNPWWNEPEFDRWWERVGREPSWASAKSDLWKYLQENTDIAIIHLKRKNLLRSKLSGLIAQTSGKWGVGATGGIGTMASKIQVNLDFKECLSDFEAHRRMETEADEFFTHHRKLDLTYEELVGDLYATSQKVQNFLSVDQHSLKAKTQKQSKWPLSEVITNYDQLKQNFSNTPWHDLFDE